MLFQKDEAMKSELEMKEKKLKEKEERLTPHDLAKPRQQTGQL